MTDSTLTPPAADMMSFLSTTPEHKNSEYETPVHTSQRTELNVIVEDGPDSKLRLAEISAAANPLLAAARPLLCALAAMPAKLDAALVEPYRNLLVREMHLYQTLCDQANLRREHVLAVRYCLCTALDEAANNTTWGRRGVWAGKSLLVTFHGESEGGIKLFQIIGRLAASFQEHGNVLEVIYHLLGLGFEGRYSVQPDGRKQLDNIRQQLLTQLSQRRDPVMPALSPDFQGAISGRLRRMRRVAGQLVDEYHRHQCPVPGDWLRHTAAGPGRCPSVCAAVGPPDINWFHPADVRAVRPVPEMPVLIFIVVASCWGVSS